MIDIAAALELAADAAGLENPVQLFSDASLVYSEYQRLSSKALTIQQLGASDQFAPFVQALARLTAVAAKLSTDPAHKKTITQLLSSI